MYFNMSVLSERTLVIDRGIALHKMIRLITYSLGGKGYLNFIGNEFGHPEWLDFPRKGNNDSFQHCRRQFNLVDDPLLRYKDLNLFDKAMHMLESKYNFLDAIEYVTIKHEQDKIISFEKDSLIFVFNFHPTKSFPDYPIPTNSPLPYKIVLNTDRQCFGGLDRIDESIYHEPIKQKLFDRDFHIKIYIPSRCAIVLSQ